MADRLFLWDEKNEMNLSNAVIASAGGYRESTEIWLTVVTGPHGARYACPSRHHRRWSARLPDRQARRLARDSEAGRWVYANVLDRLPLPTPCSSPGLKSIHEMMCASAGPPTRPRYTDSPRTMSQSTQSREVPGHRCLPPPDSLRAPDLALERSPEHQPVKATFAPR